MNHSAWDLHWTWDAVCGEPSFTVWDWKEEKFTFCFESLGIIFPVHVLLAVVSAYYIGYKGRTVRRTTTHSHLLDFRACIAFFMVLCPVVNILIQLFYLQITLSLMFYVASGVTSLAWYLHVLYIRTLKTGVTAHSRGAALMLFVWGLTFLVTFLHIYSVVLHPSCTFREQMVDEIMTLSIGTFQVLYLSSLIPKGKASVMTVHQLLTVNVEDHERAPLLSTYTDSYSQFGASPEWSDLGVALHRASAFSRLLFGWVQPLLQKGADGNLWNANCLFELPHSLRTSYVDTKFWILYKDLQLRINVKQRRESFCSVRGSTQVPQVQKKKVSLLRALLSCFGTEYFLLGILKFFSDTLTFAGPLLLNALLKYIEDRSEPTWEGYCYVLGLCGSTLLAAILSTQFNFHVSNVGLKVRAAIVTTIYRKTLCTSSTEMTTLKTGEIVNYMSTDTERIQNFCPSFHQFWSLPVQIAVCLFLLYLEVGLAFVAGISFALVLIPVNRCLANKIGEFSKAMMEQKDKRVQLMTEILRGMTVIKFYAWEKHFGKWITTYRQAELRFLKYRKYLDAGCVYFWATTPPLISLLTFLTYVLLGNNLTASKVFTSIALVNILIMPLNAFPWVLNGLVEAWVSLKRIEKLLQLPELNLASYYVQLKDSPVEAQITDADFVWKSSRNSEEEMVDNISEGATDDETGAKPFRLHSINLDVLPGQLVLVLGRVGSGKTSLLQALAAEMTRTRGQVALTDYTEGFGYVPQEPWIQQGTIRSNILFGKPYNSIRYNDTLDACALTEDLLAFPSGDETEVAERGASLSGGQKSRVALARAVYQDKSIYLLDDPLSAVDPHVAKRIFDDCIQGALKKKTRILCTHQVAFLRLADLVVVMQDGTVTHKGTPADVFPSLPSVLLSIGSALDESGSGEGATEVKKEVPSEVEQFKAQDGTLVRDEEKETGTVKFAVYRKYWSSVGTALAVSVLVMLTLMQVSRNATDAWLAHWVSDTNGSASQPNGTNVSSFIQEPILMLGGVHAIPQFVLGQQLSSDSLPYTTNATDNTFYLTVYGILVGANSIFTLLRAFLFAYGGVTAAATIHDRLISSLFDAPTSFFERNPLGRILNRFSSDLYAVDDTLPFMMNILLAQTFGLLGTLVITCYSLPWILLLIIPLFSMYLFVQDFYRHTSREVKRLSALTLSPIYAHFSETLSGLVTIRAFRAEARFRKDNEERLEKNQRVLFAIQACSQWLNLRLQMIGVVLMTGVAFLAVLRLTNASLVGLAISYALTVTSLLNGVVWSFTETEKEMVSTERALQYIEGIGSEKWQGIIEPPIGWPSCGAVSFNHVSLQYRENLPCALRNVTFDVMPGERIGIVGRTGAGKSSIFQVLFRLVELTSGFVTVDGVNIRNLDLTTLRSALAIIPQDPFIFSSTIRNNLDPTCRHDNAQLWGILEQCRLTDVVTNLGGLDTELMERGKELSLGQKQLMCLARALLTRAMVLCIDEATANVDTETDRVIQETIRTSFKHHTILTIAHRIETIMDCDRILVMSSGQVQELGAPKDLLEDPDSFFHKLAQQH